MHNVKSRKQELLVEKHLDFIRALYDLPPESLEAQVTQHIRINAIYWALISLHLLDRPDVLPRDEIASFVRACRHPDGGYGSAPGHDPHVVCTLHAIQILVLVDAQDALDAPSIARWIASLQRADGPIAGDKWGEVDMRINYAGVQALALLRSLDVLDADSLIRWCLACRNFDGGFGMCPGAESHAAHAFTSLGTLSLILDRDGTGQALDEILGSGGKDRLAWWLAMRQLKSGGLNGRPEKLEDVCYSWWVLSSLSILGRVAWIESDRLADFILGAQDDVGGGLSDRRGDVADINHTCFGLAGLSLLGMDGLQEIDPRYCMPTKVIQRLGL